MRWSGAIPAFRDGKLADPLGRRPEASLWHVIEMRPLANPFESLVQGISRQARNININGQLLQAAFERVRAGDCDGLRDAIREGAPADAHVLLVVDQFEELWTQTDEKLRAPFLDGLLGLVELAEPLRRVVLTMRRDYYFQCRTHPALYDYLERNDRQSRYSLIG